MAKLGTLEISTWQQRLAFGLRSLDWAAQLGLACMLAAVLVCGIALVQWNAQQNLLAELAQPPAKKQAQAEPQTKQDIAQQFYQLLPKASEADALSAGILRTADGLGLRFERAEFSESTQAKLKQHQIKLPVQGSYMQIRQFLNALLNAHPSLALTELQVRRDDVLSDTVQANLVLSLYLRGDAAW